MRIGETERERRLAEYQPATEEVVDLVLDCSKFHKALSDFVQIALASDSSSREREDAIKNFAVCTEMYAGAKEHYLIEQYANGGSHG
jgi:hypothetical protein